LNVRKRDQRAERRLKRDLADLELQKEIIAQLGESIKSLLAASTSNPVIGIFIGIAGVDIGQRLGIITPNGASLFYTLLGITEVGSIAASIINSLPIPFSPNKETRDFAQPTNTTTVNSYGGKTENFEVTRPVGETRKN